VLLVPLLLVCLALALTYHQTPPPAAPADGYLFCFWNVENLFDDRDDGRTAPGDKEYDGWFARSPALLELKLDRLCSALLKLNDGKGPDILAICEVESVRAAELLRQALNKRLEDESLHYANLLMKEVSGGRHIAPAILTRLPVVKDRTQLLGKRQRILEGHIRSGKQELVVIVAHWSSRVSDKEGKGRAEYADVIYGRFRAMYKSNPNVAVLICGDFNDPPEAKSVLDHLHAVGDIDTVRQASGTPLLLNVFAARNLDERAGTHYHRGKWFLFDQLVVSPGMLNGGGWKCDVASAEIVNSLVRPGDKSGQPWKFENERYKGERGYSDHFPVTVRLQVPEE
jgi:endonuclease/exonuclease/phosphatase family metal-dependent hydrolase